MKQTISIAAALVLAFTVAAGCKKSVKGEESRWASANKRATEAAALYPGFKDAIEERRAVAVAAYDAAQAIEDEKQKIDKLSSTNRLLTTGFVSRLAGVGDEIQDLRSMMVEAAGAAAEGAAKAKVTEAIKQTKAIVAQVESLLQKGAPTAVAAEAVMNRVTKDLTAAKAHLASATPAPAKAKPDTTTATAPAADTEPARWTCEYCDHSNEHDATKCANCGAAKSAK